MPIYDSYKHVLKGNDIVPVVFVLFVKITNFHWNDTKIPNAYVCVNIEGVSHSYCLSYYETSCLKSI